MPKSKTRKRPSAAPAPRQRPVGPATLGTATLALTQASLAVVQEAEVNLRVEAQVGGDVAKAEEVHHYLRTAALGLLIAHSILEGLPDPRESAPHV